MATTTKPCIFLDVVQQYAYENCCKELGIKVDYFDGLPKHEAAYKMLVIIAKALNGGQTSNKYHIPKFDFEVINNKLISSSAHADDFFYDYRDYNYYPSNELEITAYGPKSIAYIHPSLAEKSGNMFPELWFNFLTGQE